MKVRMVGDDVSVPVLGGGMRRYVFLDNAASTPALLSVQETVNEFLRWYASVHRGTGFKSRLSTRAYDDAREIIMDFVGADPQVHTAIFGRNTTDAINKLAHRLEFNEGDVVLCSLSEHHSNDLPWRSRAKVIHFNSDRGGHLEFEDFRDKLRAYAGRVKLVAVTGASNVTGFLPDIHRYAEQAHLAGARILVDCAQLGAHRAIDMRPPDDPSCLDYISLSGHKMYAPFGTGVLVGRRDTFETGEPEYAGGGTVEFVTLDEVALSPPPARDEAGSPNVVGAVAFAAAVQELKKTGMDAVAEHERELTVYALEKMKDIKTINIYGDREPTTAGERLGVIPFNLEDISHALVAAILGMEYAVGVRNGCFCAHPLLLHLLNISEEQAARVRDDIMSGDRSTMPGLVRASFGIYNTREDVDVLIEALQAVEKGAYDRERYILDKASGEYSILNYNINIEDYFSLTTPTS